MGRRNQLAQATQATAEPADGGIVTVTVPRAFRLHLDNSHFLDVVAGTCEMQRIHALHWWSVANGVAIYGPP